jgi:hypothetical protein
MPEDKQQPEKPSIAPAVPGNKKTFDVTPPGKSPAAPTSRPVILGHGPMAGDPMMADPDIKIDKEGAPAEGVPISVLTKKLKIKPLHDNIVSEESKKPKPTPETTPKTSDESEQPSEPKPAESQPSAPLAPEAVVSPPESATTPKEAEKSDTAVGATVLFSDNPVSASTEVDTAAEKPTETPAEPEQSSSAPIVKPSTPSLVAPEPTPSTDATTSTSDSEAEPKPETTEDSAKTAAKAAGEEAAKQEQYAKIIDSKEYFVPVNAVRRKRSMRMLVIGAVLIIVVVLACINFMLDAGTLTLPFTVPHTHLIKQ